MSDDFQNRHVAQVAGVIVLAVLVAGLFGIYVNMG